MINVMFVCHGNICRSPMAELVFKDMVRKRGLEDQFFIASSATSTEEIGNPVYPPAVRKLAEAGISSKGKYAIQLKRSDYDEYDYLIGMDSRNIVNMKRICGHDDEGKIQLLLSFAGKNKDIADPWYTGNFDITYDEIVEGCECFLEKIGF